MCVHIEMIYYPRQNNVCCDCQRS